MCEYIYDIQFYSLYELQMIRRELYWGRRFMVKEFKEGEWLVAKYWVDLTTIVEHLASQWSFMEAIGKAMLLADSYNLSKLVWAFSTQIEYVLEWDIVPEDKHDIEDEDDF